MGIEFYILALLGGVFAGFVTTLAGLGSVLTLYILIDVIDLPPDVANATNRVGIMAMTLLSLPTFYKKKALNLGKSWPVIGLLFLGAMVGLALALNIDNSAFREIFKYLLLVMLFLMLYKPDIWTRATDVEHKMNWWFVAPVFFAMGIYAGFIQMGTGVFLVIFLALIGRYSLVEANGVKLAAFASYTIVLILVFMYYGRINWPVGVALAIGQGTSAYFTARFATSYPNANVWVRYILIGTLIVAIIRMFNLLSYFN